ncbi:unnamed protein product [Cuscuta campestris]|uniref:Uncharacterized protein n=1 Tax=Cuscuta campestris TaxID=132261 RepID=A0A484L2I3_9ASTE|nr:unnamed protein product [Cuscuta campestris]
MLDSSETRSFPSEPPHIGDWFSSYVYRSPSPSGINELFCYSGEGGAEKEDAFVKSRDSGSETCLSSGENAVSDGENERAIELLRSSKYSALSPVQPESSDVKYDFYSYVPETPMSDENGDFSVPLSNKTNDLRETGNSHGSYERDVRLGGTDGLCVKGLVRCNTSVDTLNCSNQVIRPSDYLSPSDSVDVNVPLDSYVPETPAFDELIHSEVQESKDNDANDYGGQRKLNSSLNNCETDETCIRNGMKEKSALQFSEGLVESKTFKGNNKSLSQDSPSSDDIPLLSAPPDVRNWFSSYVYESPTLDTSDGFSLSKYEESESGVEECPEGSQKKLQNLSSTEAVFSMDRNIKNAHDPSSPKKRQCSGGNNNFSSQMEPQGSTEREKDGNGSADNGFISTRKIRSRKPDDENRSFTPRKAIDHEPIIGKDAKARRVLSDITNSSQQNQQTPDAPQIAGKWRCPQKSKPQLGPPLKQLRLEQWVRRL